MLLYINSQYYQVLSISFYMVIASNTYPFSIVVSLAPFACMRGSASVLRHCSLNSSHSAPRTLRCTCSFARLMPCGSPAAYPRRRFAPPAVFLGSSPSGIPSCHVALRSRSRRFASARLLRVSYERGSLLLQT
jgi:hypothetical protein